MLSIVFWSIYLFDLAQNFETLGIQMRTNGAPLVAVLFLFCYESDPMWSFLEIIMFILLKRSALL